MSAVIRLQVEKGSTKWFGKGNRHLVDYEIALPDESGFESGKLRLKRVETLSLEQWEAFVTESVE